MLKQHKFISFVWGLLFLIVLQIFATPEPVFRFLVPAFLLYVAVVTAYNRWYLLQAQKYNFWIALRPMLLLFSGFGLFLIIPSQFLRGLFLIISVAVITFFEIILGNFAENILLNETLLIAFGLFFSFAAFYQYTPGYGFLYLAGVFAGSSLLARSFYEFTPQPASGKLAGSLILGLFCGEFFWALNFLPLHFSALAIILFNLFYFCLILNYYYLFHILNFKKIQFHLFLIAGCSLAVLIATPWKIIQ
jgi:hypothetical protein